LTKSTISSSVLDHKQLFVQTCIFIPMSYFDVQLDKLIKMKKVLVKFHA